MCTLESVANGIIMPGIFIGIGSSSKPFTEGFMGKTTPAALRFMAVSKALLMLERPRTNRIV
jgi:hypothetical protein